jgi:hypothetical protein
LNDADSHEYADESRVRFAEFLPDVLAPFRYEYNPVDQWSLTIAVERTVRIPMDDPARIALTGLDGGGACPPEQASGPAKYVELLEAFNDFTHKRYHEARSTLGRRFNSTAFRRSIVNDTLAQYRRWSRGRELHCRRPHDSPRLTSSK